MLQIFEYKNYGTKYNNVYYLSDDGKHIILKLENKRDGIKYAKFDIEDFDLLKKCNWKLRRDSYTYYCLNSRFGFAHRLIMNCPSDKQIDHINGNGLDNRKCNLRIVTNYENSRNKHNIVGVFVAKDNRKKKYRVIWSQDNKQKSKGFEDYEEAQEYRKYIENTIYRKPYI